MKIFKELEQLTNDWVEFCSDTFGRSTKYFSEDKCYVRCYFDDSSIRFVDISFGAGEVIEVKIFRDVEVGFSIKKELVKRGALKKEIKKYRDFLNFQIEKTYKEKRIIKLEDKLNLL